MSRIGKQPVSIPEGVEVHVKNGKVAVKGPKGALNFTPHQRVNVKVENNAVMVERKGDEKLDRSLHGLTRTLIANMIKGVTSGFSKQLEIQGVGYRIQAHSAGSGQAHSAGSGQAHSAGSPQQSSGQAGQVQGAKLTFSLGFSHPVEFQAPPGIAFEIDKEKKNILTVSGTDKCLVGQVAADIRALRKPEPYKGKGIRYVGEVVRRKAGKAAVTAAK